MSYSQSANSSKSRKKRFTTKYTPDFPNTRDVATHATGHRASANTFNADTDLVFAAIKDVQIPNSELTFKRAMIYRKNADGTTGRLLIMGDKHKCLGLRENKNDEDVTGYSLPIFMYNDSGPTTEQVALVKLFGDLNVAINKWLIANARDLGRPDLQRVKDPEDDPRLPSILSWQLDQNGLEMKDKGPSLWAQFKTYFDKSTKELDCSTRVYKMGTHSEPLDPRDMVGTHSIVRPFIWVRSVSVRKDRINVQLKIWEVAAHLMPYSGPRSFLPVDEVPRDLSSYGGFNEQDTMPGDPNAEPTGPPPPALRSEPPDSAEPVEFTDSGDEDGEEHEEEPASEPEEEPEEAEPEPAPPAKAKRAPRRRVSRK